MNPLRPALLLLALASFSFGQTTLFHYRVTPSDAAVLESGSVPSVAGADGVAQGALTLSADIPTLGVPPGAGDRSLDNGGDGGVTAPGTRQLTNAAIIAAGGFTYETWFKWAGGGNVNAIIDYAGTEKLRIPSGGGTLDMNFDSGSGPRVLGAVTPGQWHYLAAVFAHDGQPESGGQIDGTLTWYLDGKTPAGSASVTKDDFGDDLNRTIAVAMHPNGFAGDYFDGLVYEPRVTLGALTSNALLFAAGPRIESFTSDVESIAAGQSATLSWEVTGASSVQLAPGVGAVPHPTGSIMVMPAVTTTYALTATNAEGSTVAQVTVFVDEPPAEPVLNEFLADNDNDLRDEDGENSDWIEIRNPNAFTIALDGWGLTDRPFPAIPWNFPAGTTVAGNGYLVVFASGQDRRDPARELHTSFQIDNAGEYLALVRPDGTAAQEFAPSFPRQFEDKSYGWSEDGPTLGYFDPPTPGAPNGAGVQGFVADTKFEPNRGFFETPTAVTITANTPGATIVYTTDSSTPTLTNGTAVPAPDALSPPTASVPVSQTTTLRAAAFLAGHQPTNVDTHTYLFLDDVIVQSPNGETPSGWPSGTVNGQVFDYGMDPNIVNHPTWGPQLIDGLKQIPSISIVTDQRHLTSASTGIYTHAGNDGDTWERPGSIELLLPDNIPGFQANAGVRIRGGFSRGGFNPKHSFRFFFRGIYGPRNLNYPLFDDEGADEFDKVDLRTAQNYAWSNDTFNNELHNTFVRDVFHRDTQREMGQPYTRSRYYHLYLNGQYWGLYQTQERSESAFANTYFGGSRENWDVIKPGGGAVRASDGNLDAYYALHALATAGFATDAAYYAVQGKNPDRSDNPALERHLEIDNLIDYMLVNFFCGNNDGPLSLGGGGPNNFYALRNREPAARDAWKFFCHDSEHSMAAADHNVNVNVTGTTSTGTQRSAFNPRWLSQQLAQHPDYRRRFGDRVQAHFFNDGALSEAHTLARWNARAAQIDLAIVAESARWGDQHNEPPLNKQTWATELGWMRNTFLPNRAAVVLNQLRAAGLFPAVAAPAFSQHGGTVPGGAAIAITAPAGAIYYTTDGTDPRPGGVQDGVTLLAAGAGAKALIPTGPVDDGWRGGDEPFDDSSWLTGITGVGFETGTGYEAFIGLDVEAMRTVNATVLVRVAFEAPDASAFDALTLRMRYDDGFVAFLNGVEIARRLAPETLAWNSTTANGQTHEAGPAFEEIDVSAHLGALAPGANILAIHGLNATANSSDLIIQPELVASTVSTGGNLYTGPVILNQFTELRAAALAGGQWSALTKATFLVDTVPAGPGNLVIAEFSYRPGAPSPTEDPGGLFDRGDFEFVELLNIGAATIDLTGVHFAAGIAYVFAANTILAAGQRLVLVKNTAAFEARYGSGVPIAGEFAGSLSNDGEEIVLRDAWDGDLRRFTYNDQPPWPTAADGEGYSLVLLAPLLNPDHNQPANWRSSVELHGSPGDIDTISFADWMGSEGIIDPFEDADLDGLNALAEFATGSDPWTFTPGDEAISLTTLLAGDPPARHLEIAMRRDRSAGSLVITPERSTDLVNWDDNPLGFQYLGSSDRGDGTSTLTWRAIPPLDTGPRAFLRIRLEAVE